MTPWDTCVSCRVTVAWHSWKRGEIILSYGFLIDCGWAPCNSELVLEVWKRTTESQVIRVVEY